MGNLGQSLLKDRASVVVEIFFSMLKESKIGFAVDIKGNFIFQDQVTGEKVYLLKEDTQKAYEEL